MGERLFSRTKEEKKNKSLRRSIFAIENIKKGQKFTKINIKKIRPGMGLSPKYYGKLINKKSPKNFSKGEPLKNSILKKIF